MGWAASARRRAAGDERFPLVFAAQVNAARMLLGDHGPTPDGLFAVAANVHDFATAMASAAAAKTDPKPACAAGCSWCCCRPLSVLPLEAFHVAAAVMALPDETRARVLGRVGVAAKRHTDLGERELHSLREPCPLLEYGRCAIYTARPAECVARNAADPEPCRLDVEEGRPAGQDDNRTIAMIPRRLVETAQDVVCASVKEAGGDGPAPDGAGGLRFLPALGLVLNGGVRESAARWLAGEPLFAGVPGEARQA